MGVRSDKIMLCTNVIKTSLLIHNKIKKNSLLRFFLIFTFIFSNITDAKDTSKKRVQSASKKNQSEKSQEKKEKKEKPGFFKRLFTFKKTDESNSKKRKKEEKSKTKSKKKKSQKKSVNKSDKKNTLKKNLPISKKKKLEPQEEEPKKKASHHGASHIATAHTAAWNTFSKSIGSSIPSRPIPKIEDCNHNLIAEVEKLYPLWWSHSSPYYNKPTSNASSIEVLFKKDDDITKPILDLVHSSVVSFLNNPAGLETSCMANLNQCIKQCKEKKLDIQKEQNQFKEKIIANIIKLHEAYHGSKPNIIFGDSPYTPIKNKIKKIKDLICKKSGKTLDTHPLTTEKEKEKETILRVTNKFLDKYSHQKIANKKENKELYQ